jgi:hypothetical protein
MSTTKTPRASAVATLLADAASCRDKLAIDTLPPDAPVARELASASASFEPAIHRLVRSADLWTMIATDHLAGIALIVRPRRRFIAKVPLVRAPRTSLFSIFPLFRSVIEHSAYVAWVLDDRADIKKKAARAALVELHGQEHLLGAATLLAGKGTPTRTSHRAYGKQLRNSVQAEFGVTLTEPYAIEGETLPMFVEVVESFGTRWGNPRAWAGIYGYFCGTGNHPSFNAYEYLELTAPTVSPPILSRGTFLRLLNPVMVAYLKALEMTAGFIGFPDQPVNEYIDRVNAVLGPTLISEP